MHVVFLGNCQAATLHAILCRFVVPYGGVTTDFVDAHAAGETGLKERLDRADVVVAQVAPQSAQPVGHEHIPAGRPVHLVPVVNGSFLYPYQGVPHPADPRHWNGQTVFQPEYCDRILAKLFEARVSPQEAVARYRRHDVARAANVGRFFELAIEGQRRVDAATGYACADIIERYLTEEQLFQSAFHFSGRIARHLAAPLCDNLGFDAKYGERIRDHLADAPFIRHVVPVHPSVARYFGLRWVKDDTLYPFRYEGGITLDQYVARYMEVRWNAALEEGVAAGRRDEPGAKAKLEKGLAETPGSAEGAHELSRICEREGDLQQAIVWQKQASSVALDFDMPFRLGDLLLRVGDVHAAEQAYRRAVERDPVHPEGWLAWCASLMRLGHLEQALAAARQAVVYAIDPTGPQQLVARLRDRLLDEELAVRLRGGSADEEPADWLHGGPVDGPPSLPVPAPVVTVPATGPAARAVDLMAHVQDLGDVVSGADGWVGEPGSGLWIEGFAVLQTGLLPAASLTYQAVRADQSLSEPVELGGYCGSRGEHAPLFGLLVSLDDRWAGSFDVMCEASFVDGSRSGPVPSGISCKAEESRLEAFRITLAAIRKPWE